jgi:hypothetical protein
MLGVIYILVFQLFNSYILSSTIYPKKHLFEKPKLLIKKFPLLIKAHLL